MRRKLTATQLLQSLDFKNSISDISHMFSCSKNTIHVIACRHKISLVDYNKERIAKIVESSFEIGCRDTATKYGISLQSIYAYRHRDKRSFMWKK